MHALPRDRQGMLHWDRQGCYPPRPTLGARPPRGARGGGARASVGACRSASATHTHTHTHTHTYTHTHTSVVCARSHAPRTRPWPPRADGARRRRRSNWFVCRRVRRTIASTRSSATGRARARRRATRSAARAHLGVGRARVDVIARVRELEAVRRVVLRVLTVEQRAPRAVLARAPHAAARRRVLRVGVALVPELKRRRRRRVLEVDLLRGDPLRRRDRLGRARRGRGRGLLGLLRRRRLDLSLGQLLLARHLDNARHDPHVRVPVDDGDENRDAAGGGGGGEEGGAEVCDRAGLVRRGAGATHEPAARETGWLGGHGVSVHDAETAAPVIRRDATITAKRGSQGGDARRLGARRVTKKTRSAACAQGDAHLHRAEGGGGALGGVCRTRTRPARWRCARSG